MTTTHSDKSPEGAPEAAAGALEPAARALAERSRRRDAALVAAGALLGPLGFAFGGYACALALPGVWRPARAFGVSLFASSLLCVALSAAGLNPVAVLARERALDAMEAALGSRPSYASFSSSPARGMLAFASLKCELPDTNGRVEILRLEVENGPGFAFGLGGTRVRAEGVTLALDGSDTGFEAWASRLARGEGAPASFEARISDIEATLRGENVSARVRARTVVVTGEAGDGLAVSASPERLELDLFGVRHGLDLRGLARVSIGPAGFGLEADLHFREPELGTGFLRGTLKPDFGADGLGLVIDRAPLAPLYARYRLLDSVSGQGSGTVDIAGDFTRLRFRPELEIARLGYSFPLASSLAGVEPFDCALLRVGGEFALLSGVSFDLTGLTLAADDTKLATGPSFAARGKLRVVLSGRPTSLLARAVVEVAQGRIEQPISWMPHRAGLEALEPNVLVALANLPGLTVEAGIEVKNLALNCDPLSGVLEGRLEARVQVASDRPEHRTTVRGELELKDGRFDFCAARGTATGKLVFRDVNPPRQARLEGRLQGSAGDTPVQAEVSGSLAAPFLRFTGVRVAPSELGRLLVEADDAKLDELTRVARRVKLADMCGLEAASRKNPFLVASTGRVFFDFR